MFYTFLRFLVVLVKVAVVKDGVWLPSFWTAALKRKKKSFTLSRVGPCRSRPVFNDFNPA